jgi:hypothetical protein
MKKTILIVLMLFAAPAFAATPEHFFDSLAFHPQQPPLPVATVPPPPILTPIDPTPTIAMVAAAQANNDNLWTWTRDSLVNVGKVVDQIVADEAIEVGETLNLKNRVSALEAKAPIPGPVGPQGIQGLQGIQGVPGPQGQAGSGGSLWVGVDAATVCKWARSANGFTPGVPGISDKAFGFISAGDCLQFPISMPAGTNALAVAVSSPNTTATYHFESPLGTRISATVTATTTGNWAIYQTQIVPLTAIPSGSVWWICDTLGLNIAGVKPSKQ